MHICTNPSLFAVVRGFFDAAYRRLLLIAFTTKPVSKIRNCAATNDWRNDVNEDHKHIKHLLPSKIPPEVKATPLLYHLKICKHISFQ